jgi:hypothetical protein
MFGCSITLKIIPMSYLARQQQIFGFFRFLKIHILGFENMRIDHIIG